MTKQAADKISQEYYTIGQQLALDNFSKTAGLPKEVIKKLVQAAVAGGGAYGGAQGGIELMKHIPMETLAALPELSTTTGVLTSAGGGAMLGANLAGKGVEGINNLITKMQLARLRR